MLKALRYAGCLCALLITAVSHAQEEDNPPDFLRIGIIGLDTSHATAFTKMLNGGSENPAFANCRVVAAYPKGSPDIQSSVVRVPGYIVAVKAQGVKIVDSIEALVEQVDAVLLETNDGRPHLEQILPVLKAGKPVFIDKPVAGSLQDAVAIYLAAEKYDVPVFSSSSLRYANGTQGLRSGEAGTVWACDTYSPAPLEATHPDLFWYGIHGVEMLFTVMGSGCESVARHHSDQTDVVVGHWKDGRIGTFRGLREPLKTGYGGTAFTEEGIYPLGPHAGYEPLLADVIHFFRTGEAPVTPEETLEIYAFMEGADVSKEAGGEAVSITDLLAKAREAAEQKLATMTKQ